MTEKIINDLKNAMKAQDKFKLSVLRMLKSALQNEVINQKKETLSDDEVIKIIKKQVKIRKDSLEEYKKYDKAETVLDLTKEIEILNKYLPEEPSEETIKSCLELIFEEVNPTSMKDMGLIMKKMGEKMPNADMTLVSKLVKEKLSWWKSAFFY